MSKNNEERNLSYKNQSLNLRYFKYTFNTTFWICKFKWFCKCFQNDIIKLDYACWL